MSDEKAPTPPLQIGTSPATAYIHYNPERIDYAISDAELEQLRACTDSFWKDFFLVAGSLGIPCILNAISEAKNMKDGFKATLSFNLNLVVGILGILLAVAFLIAWLRTRKSGAEIVRSIKNKPKIRLN